MMNSTIVLTGWLGSDVRLNRVGETQVAHFRVGHTPRRYDRAQGAWVDGQTQWYDVSAWRGLAANCAESLRRGDPVVVHGRVRTSSWTRDGANFSSFDVEADFVGHDLSFGVSAFRKMSRYEQAPGNQTGPERDADNAVDTADPADTAHDAVEAGSSVHVAA